MHLIQFFFLPGRLARMHLASVVFFLFFVTALAAFETGGQLPVLTYEEGLQQLLTNNAAILKEDAVLLNFKALQDEVKGTRLPSMSFLAAVAPVSGGSGDAVNGRWTGNWGVGVHFESEILWPVFSFGKLADASRAANAAYQAGTELRQSRINDIIFEYKKIYLSLILLKRYKLVLDEGMAKLDQALQYAEEAFSSGTGEVQTRDVARLRIFSLEFQKLHSEWVHNHTMAQSALGHYLGLQGQVNVAENDFPLAEAEMRALTAYIQEGFRQRADWKALEHGIEARSSQLKLEEKSNLPVLAIGARAWGGYSNAFQDQVSPFAFDPYNEVLGTVFVGARWQLDFGKSWSKTTQARAELETLQARKKEAMTGIPLEISIAFSEIEKNREQWALARKKYKEASKWSLSELNAYTLGTGDPKDLLESLYSSQTAAKDMAEAEYNYNLSWASLALKAGNQTLLERLAVSDKKTGTR